MSEAIRMLDDPERVRRHDPARLFSEMSLPDGAVIVDLGCGTGFFSLPARSAAGSGGVVFAVDSNQSMLNVVREKISQGRIQNLYPILSDVHRVPLPDHIADLVIMANIFHDLRRLEALVEVGRLLKSGGSGRLVLIEWKKIPTERGPPLELRLTQEEASELLRGSGYAIQSAFETSSSHYCLIAQAPPSIAH